MTKLSEKTFHELVKMGVELELDHIVSGVTLKGRVHSLMELAVRWSQECRGEEESKKWRDARKKIFDERMAQRPENFRSE